MNATLQAEQASQTTMNYPGFQALPKGARQMLRFSEEYFFNEPAVEHAAEVTTTQRLPQGMSDYMGIPLMPVGFRLRLAA
jgi:hypothetical protein